MQIILEDCCILMLRDVKRNSNSVIHILVKHAICILDFQVWMEDIPPHIISFLHWDVIHLP